MAAGFVSSGSGPTAPSLTPTGGCAGSRVSLCDRSQPSGTPGRDTGLEASSLNLKQRVAHKKHKIAKHVAPNRPGRGLVYGTNCGGRRTVRAQQRPERALAVTSPRSALTLARPPRQAAEGYGRKPLLGETPQHRGLGGRLGSLLQGHVLASL